MTAGTEPLLDLLDARSGVVCAVGAGGKKSVLVRLASRHPGRVAITATVFTTYVQEQIGFVAVVDEAERLPGRIAAIDAASSVAYACPATQPARRAGVPAAVIERIHREGGFAATYVKADGARMRLIKSPAEDEPVLPASCRTVIVVVSAHAIGEALRPRIAHRLPRITEVLGLAEGATLTAAHGGSPRRAGDQHGRRSRPGATGPGSRRGCARADDALRSRRADPPLGRRRPGRRRRASLSSRPREPYDRTIRQ